MADYVEEKTFVLRLELRCAFPEDYDGEEDGYEWAEDAPALTAAVVQAAAAALQARPGWRVRPANRGRSKEDEVTLVVERQLAAARPEGRG
jgi:hypothetical protein